MVFVESGYITLGLLGLWFGSDIVVDNARTIAKSLGVSELLIGLSITSIGTSLPEISTNISAGFSTAAGVDASGIAVGNIIGSELSQITIILGIAGFMATLSTTRRSLRRDGFMMLSALLLMYLVCFDGFVSRGEGAFLVIIYLTYLAFLFFDEGIVSKLSSHEGLGRNFLYKIILLFVGVVIIIYSADVIVEKGVLLADKLSITESLIGLFIGFGTSIPELSVTVKAVTKKANSLSLGNLMGSNITDPLLSFGLGAVVGGFTVSQSVLAYDFVYWGVATVIALLLLFNHLNLNRKESSVLIVLYLFFMYSRIVFFP
ncbi:MAG: hypothetical protein B6U97_00295 [Candidatus Altiarchaeales archaeon ex4484_96]|nr:MAG: hypothetical protein B6U97_00295 [Candidatus Altiarchaeales archaeon ex4484_96]